MKLKPYELGRDKLTGRLVLGEENLYHGNQNRDYTRSFVSILNDNPPPGCPTQKSYCLNEDIDPIQLPPNAQRRFDVAKAKRITLETELKEVDVEMTECANMKT